MILRYKGKWAKINKDKWKSQTIKEKAGFIKEYFSDETKYTIERIKNYWIGYVEVKPKNILCGGYGTDEPSHNEIYEISIICGRFHDGQCFSYIGKDLVEQLVRDWEFLENKRFQLHLDLGCGMSQNYTFSKRQKDMLIKQLKPLLEMKWYKSDGIGEDDDCW